jgi:two-component system sensor histidine kinase and response regulator WspE
VADYAYLRVESGVIQSRLRTLLYHPKIEDNSVSYDPNEMMLELFRAEVESHSESLTSSLLRLEQDPTETVLLDGMMRAAHSIKGAARIVRIDAAVDIAHVMEDCFVAAQRGELVLEPTGIDILLRAVDLLGQVSEASKNPNVDWDAFQPAIQSTVSQLRNVLHGQPLVASPSIAPAVESQRAVPAPHVEAPHVEVPGVEVPGVEMLGIAMPGVQASAHRISIPERLNVSNAESIRLQLLSAFEDQSDRSQVIIDLSLTQDMDSIGLALMHSVTQFAASNNLRLRFENASSVLVRVFRAVGIRSVGHGAEIGSEGIQDVK